MAKTLITAIVLLQDTAIYHRNGILSQQKIKGDKHLEGLICLVHVWKQNLEFRHQAVVSANYGSVTFLNLASVLFDVIFKECHYLESFKMNI